MSVQLQHSRSHASNKTLLGAEVATFSDLSLVPSLIDTTRSPREGQPSWVYHLQYNVLAQRTPGKPNSKSHPVTAQGGGRELRHQ